ncbi:hypothetical protein ACJX0J_024246, partial [Zea mays]
MLQVKYYNITIGEMEDEIWDEAITREGNGVSDHVFGSFSCCRISLAPHEQEVQEVDWDALQIIETNDDEGRLQVASEEQLYDERAQKDRQDNIQHSHSSVPNINSDVDGATIYVDDHIPNERLILYNKDKPEMKVGALIPSMIDFIFSTILFIVIVPWVAYKALSILKKTPNMGVK